MVKDIYQLRDYMNKKTIDKDMINLYKERKDEKRISFDQDYFFSFLEDVHELVLLDYLRSAFTEDDVFILSKKVQYKLNLILKENKTENIEEKVSFFMNSIPELRISVLESADTIFNDDPASDTVQEVILCYPGFLAIFNYRVAHLFYRMGLKFMARLISEDAHSKTGIDINPGATIGRNFFIDHGTGIVIGETCVIGDNVKVYQGVTLGALSLKDGNSLRGKKRHPTIENNVTIYSNAAIFGGETVIGENSTIGAVTYITSSVPKNSVVYAINGQTTIASKKH